MGTEGPQAARRVNSENPGLIPGRATETGGLEKVRRQRNVTRSGEMHRYVTEHR